MGGVVAGLRFRLARPAVACLVIGLVFGLVFGLVCGLYQRQQPHRTAAFGQRRGLRLVQRVAPLGARRVEHGIDPVQHLGTVAPRAVGAQHRRPERVAQHLAGGAEQARVGAAEAVDRLLGIAHQEHGRALAQARVASQPALQDAPLQRVGVLELVEQQMAVTRIEPHLQVGGGLFVRHQARGLPFQVSEVHRALLVLVPLVARQQGIADAEQRAVDRQHRGFATTRADVVKHGADRCMLVQQRLDHAFAAGGLDQRRGAPQRTRAAGGGEERGAQLREHPFGGLAGRRARFAPRGDRHQRIGDAGGVALLGLAGRAQAQRQRLAGIAPAFVGQRLQQHVALGVFAQAVGQRLQRAAAFLHRPPFAARMEHGIEQRARLEVAHGVDQRFPGGAQVFVLRRGQRAPDRRPRFALHAQGILAQRRAGHDARCQRRAAQQRAEPAVEGIDGHAPGCGQHLRMQAARARQRLARCLRRQPTLHQRGDDVLVGIARQLRQHFQQAVAHFFGGLAREGDREDLVRRGAGQQQAHQARHQQPGLAAAGAGLDHDRARGIAGGARELGLRHGMAIALVGLDLGIERIVDHHVFSTGTAVDSQKPLRHRPRAVQYTQAEASPNAGS
ncbi:hypothetical protein D9M72_312380 [compost metagenome]